MSLGLSAFDVTRAGKSLDNTLGQLLIQCTAVTPLVVAAQSGPRNDCRGREGDVQMSNVKVQADRIADRDHLACGKLHSVGRHFQNFTALLRRLAIGDVFDRNPEL